MMCRYKNRRSTLWIVTLVVLLAGGESLTRDARAGEHVRPVRIGGLTESWGISPQEVGLRDGLVALGYRENEQFVIGSRFTQGDIAALPAAAHELVEFGSDLIFAVTARAALAAQKATTQLPIVFAGAVDPLKLGLVRDFARPGGNVTGVADLSLELGPKRLEVFRQTIPGLKRVLFPYDATDASTAAEVQVYRNAARRLGIVLLEKAVATQDEAQKTIAAVRKGEVDGILAPRCCALNIPGFILEATSQQGIPTMFDFPFWVERGALASYGPDHYHSGRQAARLVDKILKGANPAEIPVEVNTKIELVINLKVAKTLGLKIPAEVLFRADKVIR